MDVVIAGLLLLVGLLAGVLLGLRWARRGAESGQATHDAEVRVGLDRLGEQLAELQHQGSSWQGQLHQQVDDVRHGTEALRRETSALSTALRRPQVRGRWGELHLRRVVELAGMVEHCDFTEQHTARDGTSDGERVLRPDLVVHLAGGRSVVVDAKVPLDAQLDAMAADDPAEVQAHLERHVRQVRQHVTTLSAKRYARLLPQQPEFVVMFLPAEAFLISALQADDELVEWASARDVVIATPSTLIALLRTVAHGWTTLTLAERTREVHELGRQLYERLAVMGGHLDRMGRSLKSAVEAYNSTVGSLESRVLVTARQFADADAVRGELPSPRPVTATPRPLTAAELLEAATPARAELPGDAETQSTHEATHEQGRDTA